MIPSLVVSFIFIFGGGVLFGVSLSKEEKKAIKGVFGKPHVASVKKQIDFSPGTEEEQKLARDRNKTAPSQLAG